MEEFDDLSQKPTDSGELDMSHRAWRILENSIWEWGTKLFILNISYNQIEEIPGAIKKLRFLREFNCSSNAITAIPPEIGNCHKLKILKANGNHIRELPDEIEGCRLLEELIISENELMALPDTIGTLSTLSILKWYFTDATIILWVCQLQDDQNKAVTDLEVANQDLEDHMRHEEEQNIELRTEVQTLKKTRDALMKERPVYYMAAVKIMTKVKSKACTIQ
eukprot:g722.t1